MNGEGRTIRAGEPYPVSERIRIYRWFFYLSSLQVFMYFLVPALQLPSRMVFHIELISALTLGNVVVMFFLLVNVGGIIIDRERRSLYTGLLVFVCLWLGLVALTWARLERWEFLLR
jgi:hypothetical protein